MLFFEKRTKYSQHAIQCNHCCTEIRKGLEYVALLQQSVDRDKLNNKGNICAICLVKIGVQLFGGQ